MRFLPKCERTVVYFGHDSKADKNFKKGETFDACSLGDIFIEFFTN